MKRLAVTLGAFLWISCGEPISVNEFSAHTGVIKGTVVYPQGTARGIVAQAQRLRGAQRVPLARIRAEAAQEAVGFRA